MVEDNLKEEEDDDDDDDERTSLKPPILDYVPLAADEEEEDVEDYLKDNDIVNGKETADIDMEKKQITSYDDKSTDYLRAQVDSLNKRLDKQQDYIDRILRLLAQQRNGSSSPQSQSGGESDKETATTTAIDDELSAVEPQEQLWQGPPIATTATTKAVVPLKAMLFIDGTWLYYSIYGREEGRCPIQQKYGFGWPYRYSFDWRSLPRVICQALQDPGWSSAAGASSSSSAAPGRISDDLHGLNQQMMTRPLEIVRALVITSYKADTSTSTLRYQMFKEMKEVNFDVHQMETVGKNEKCVDIQLAVEMLHFATVPDAFDIAILLTGDKDFLPLMVRTRQKGRRVALVSMRDGCNRALKVMNGIKDYDIVWLEDHLDTLLIPRLDTSNFPISLLTVEIVIKHFIEVSGFGQVNSRDVGRFLQRVSVGNAPLLRAVRYLTGGLSSFFRNSKVFETEGSPFNEDDSKKFAFWIKLCPDAEQSILEMSKLVTFSAEEKAFLDTYDTNMMEDPQTAYYHTLLDIQALREHQEQQPVSGTQPLTTKTTAVAAAGITQEIMVASPMSMSLPVEDYSTYTVSKLKEECRQRHLPMSGLKAQLLARVMEHAEKERLAQLSSLPLSTTPPPPVLGPPGNAGLGDAAAATTATHDSGGAGSGASLTSAPPKVAEYLQCVVKEYLLASGGEVSSRDVGRYLACNKSSDGVDKALPELKRHYSNLSYFISCYPEMFGRDELGADDDFSFLVILLDKKP